MPVRRKKLCRRSRVQKKLSFLWFFFFFFGLVFFLQIFSVDFSAGRPAGDRVAHSRPICALVILGGAPRNKGIADVLCENFEKFFRPWNLVYSSNRMRKSVIGRFSNRKWTKRSPTRRMQVHFLFENWSLIDFTIGNERKDRRIEGCKCISYLRIDHWSILK